MPDYIEVQVKKSMIDFANKKIKEVKFNRKELNKFGSEKGRTFFGYLGQAMVYDYLGIPEVDTFDFDGIYNNEKLEIKTISCKFEPYSHYLCTVNSHDLEGVHKQQADHYVFTRIKNDKSIGWILGYISCEEFFKKGIFKSKGSEITSNPNVGKFEKANATVLEIQELYNIRELMKRTTDKWLRGKELFFE